MVSKRLCKICRSRICVCAVKVCNCARCGVELTRNPLIVSAIWIAKHDGLRPLRDIRLLADRVDNRPYCRHCVPTESDPGEVEMRFHSCRAAGQRAKLGSAY